MPSAQAHPPDDDRDRREAGKAGGEERPLFLEEVDDALQESAAIAGATGAGAIRSWRNSFTVILETLTYARGVLAGDVGILRHRLASDAPSSKELVDDLPRALAAGSWGTDWSGTEDESGRAELDPGIFVRSDALLAVHAEMASVDLTSAADVRRVLAVLEEQLAAVTARHVAVQARLDEIARATLRENGEGSMPSPDRPD